MRIAFYAPLKPPDHPVPSGDRRIARLLLEALRRAGHEVALASRLRSYRRRRRPGAPGTAAPARRRASRRACRSRRCRRWQPRALVHLPPLPQGAGLARPARSRRARHSLCRGRGLVRAQARDRAMGRRATRRGGRDRRRRHGPRAQPDRSRNASCRCCGAGRGRRGCRRFSTAPASAAPPRRRERASRQPGARAPHRSRRTLAARGRHDAAGRQARLLPACWPRRSPISRRSAGACSSPAADRRKPRCGAPSPASRAACIGSAP